MAASFIDPTNPLDIFTRGRNPLDPNNPPRNPYGGLFETPSVRAQVMPRVGGTASNMPPGTNPSTIDDYYQRIMGLMPSRRQQGLTDAGSVLGALGANEQTNRVLRGNFQQNYDQMQLEREQARNALGQLSQADYDRLKLASAGDKRTSTSDAMQKIQLGGHLQRGDRITDPKTGAVSYRPRSDQEQAAATGLIDQMHAQLNRPEYEPTKFEGKYDYQPADPSSYTRPGKMENVGRYGDLAGGALGALDGIFGRGGNDGGGGGTGNRLSSALDTGRSLWNAGKTIGNFFGGANKATSIIPGTGIPTVAGAGGTGMIAPAGMAGAGGVMSNLLGKAVPIAGAVTGGIGLMKNRGTKANIMNGMTAGASIGSMVPGVGTAIGAGAGALAGFLRGVGRPSEQAVQGREAAAEGRQALTAGATPEQIQESQGAGWKNPQDALTSIVLRDKFGQDRANQMTQQLWQAEKGGPEAVNNILRQLSAGRNA